VIHIKQIVQLLTQSLMTFNDKTIMKE